MLRTMIRFCRKQHFQIGTVRENDSRERRSDWGQKEREKERREKKKKKRGNARACRQWQTMRITAHNIPGISPMKNSSDFLVHLGQKEAWNGCNGQAPPYSWRGKKADRDDQLTVNWPTASVTSLAVLYLLRKRNNNRYPRRTPVKIQKHKPE